MATFRYDCLTEQHERARGHLEADSAKHARSQLRARGLTVLEVTPLSNQTASSSTSILTQGATTKPTHFNWGRHLNAGQQALCARQLGSLLAAGLPLERALGVLIEQADQVLVGERLAAVRGEVLAGHSLADALARYPQDFPALMRAVVAAGEASGQLAGVLERLADYLEGRNALRQKVIMAFTYPVLVTSVALLVVLILMTYVVPQIVEVFANTKQSLPFLTRALIVLSDALRHYGWIALVGLVGAALAARAAVQRPAVRLRWHARLLTAPVLGKVLQASNTAHFASTLAILVGSGVPLLRALQAAGETMSNLSLQAVLTAATQRVREGSPLARALAVEKAFPPVLLHMIASGESTGQLPSMLERAGEGQRREVERRAILLTQLLEPLLILGMGVIVLLIVLAVLMPIIEINHLIR